MLPADDSDYLRLGTPENILVRAGLVTATRADDGFRIEAGPELGSLFAPAPVPAVRSIVPYLLDIVVAEAFDRSGFLTSGDLRMHAVAMLRDAGMKAASGGVMAQKISAAADAAKADLIKSKKAWF